MLWRDNIDYEIKFLKLLLIGAEQVHLPDSDKIVLSSDNKYQKKLQPQYPQNPESWYSEQEVTPPHEMKETPRIRKVEKGLRRWKELPQPTDVRIKQLFHNNLPLYIFTLAKDSTIISFWKKSGSIVINILKQLNWVFNTDPQEHM